MRVRRNAYYTGKDRGRRKEKDRDRQTDIHRDTHQYQRLREVKWNYGLVEGWSLEHQISYQIQRRYGHTQSLQ